MVVVAVVVVRVVTGTVNGQLERPMQKCKMFVKASSKPHGIAIHTDGSVTRTGLVEGSRSSIMEALYTKTESRPPD